jgi:AbrB family looped-hinge helix DNA binding protein
MASLQVRIAGVGSAGMAYFRAEKQIDQLGRIVVPAPIRHLLSISLGDIVDVRVVDDHIEIAKVDPRCVFCGANTELRELHGKYACSRCVADIGSAREVPPDATNGSGAAGPSGTPDRRSVNRPSGRR